VRRRTLKLLSLVVLFSTIPIALVGLDAIHCVFGNYDGPCTAFSLTRLGLIGAVLVLALLLWALADTID
jgi:hypothetical protein